MKADPLRVSADATYHGHIAEKHWARYLTAVEEDVVLDAHRQVARSSAVLTIGAAGGRWSMLFAARGWQLICGRHLQFRLQGEVGFDGYSTCYGTWRRWKTRLRQRGFEILREEGLCWMLFSRESDLPLTSPLIALKRHLGLWRLPNVNPWAVFLARKHAGA
ncbi:conserved protein of unknown function (plasmid) [Rhodovastum atsumiense]|uniref:Class I SAM-dependent methyltransferase n=1 Tax=Rhodovastum atsumiense TaxID=504468 RepID=A0A5M6IJK0_9PROT|nr:hypothetical protein [Rhodovastum atsumiense]KAA5608430.1 hypothetical protein F1189_29115 [Rhodovastum atsumiense]CAH2605713.1 conserved protein of unknown function [Rhodovastum atsumiense]